MELRNENLLEGMYEVDREGDEKFILGVCVTCQRHGCNCLVSWPMKCIVLSKLTLRFC
jgi:hypothetical protein